MPVQKRFTKAQTEILSEIYRRLNFFHNGDVTTNLLYLSTPTQAKKVKKYGLIKPYREEIKGTANWYNLTAKGQKFFENYSLAVKLPYHINNKLANGEMVLEFDLSLLK